MSGVKKIASRLLELSNIDHRVIGAKQSLFFFDAHHSHGSCFFEPRGAHIYNKLIDYLRNQYKRRNYEEVITPNIFDCRLWQTSGHWDHYKDNMIKFNMAEREFSLKPMNCPAHCLMFKNLGLVWASQLPVRWADFGALHRNELSGTLVGLTRVRRFQQDDAHIFCTPDQVESEVRDCLEFAREVYTHFDFQFDICLSLRPQEYMGHPNLWDKAENSLRGALSASKVQWTEQGGEGAFYGPKIDMIVKDCRGRSQQCATIQLDFQLPQRFDLRYKLSACEEEKGGDSDDGDDHEELMAAKRRRPVMIHRAILGSIERFIAMVAENCGGRWPFWLSPLQAHIIPVAHQHNDYALRVERQLKQSGFMVNCQLDPNLRVAGKIREAEMTKYNFILVVGAREEANNLVTVRFVLDQKVHQMSVSIEQLMELFKKLEESRTKDAERELLNAEISLQQQRQKRTEKPPH